LYTSVHFPPLRAISITEGRKKLGEFVSIVMYQHCTIVLEKHGKPEALLVALPADADLSTMAGVNAESGAFAFLADEPDLYSCTDLRRCHAS
jgi:prevent-host-death family protein